MIRIVLSAVGATALCLCAGAGDPPKRPPSLRTQIEAADRLIAQSENVKDIHEGKVLDGELLATLAVSRMNSENANVLTIEGTVTVTARPLEDYYGALEKKYIAERAQMLSDRLKFIASQKGGGRESAAAREAHQRGLKPLIERARARKEWYETTLVVVDVARTDAMDMTKALTKKTVTVPVTVKAIELQDRMEMPALADDHDRYQLPTERPKLPVRVRRLDCTAAAVPDGCEATKK